MALQAFNPWVRLLRDIAVLPNSTRSLVFSAFQFLRPDGPGQLLLLWLIPLGSALGTRSRRCRPILFLPIVFQTRPDVRIRVRSIVIRIRVRHTAIRIRVVVAAIDHTAYWENPPFSDCKVTKSFLSLSFCYDFTTFFRRADARILYIFALTLCRFAPDFSLHASSDHAHATSVNALYAATLEAFTRWPRKARRDPMLAYVLEAS